MTELRTVLILTKDEEFRRLCTQHLVGHDCAARVEEKSAEAVLTVLENEIDVLIFDADCEELKTVTTTVKIIEKCRPRIPIVVATSDHSIMSGSTILKEGIFYYLIKPLVAAEFGEVVERALVKRAYLEKGR
jgi:DNA-binding NtrC family response regulator